MKRWRFDEMTTCVLVVCAVIACVLGLSAIWRANVWLKGKASGVDVRVQAAMIDKLVEETVRLRIAERTLWEEKRQKREPKKREPKSADVTLLGALENLGCLHSECQEELDLCRENLYLCVEQLDGSYSSGSSLPQ